MHFYTHQSTLYESLALYWHDRLHFPAFPISHALLTCDSYTPPTEKWVCVPFPTCDHSRCDIIYLTPPPLQGQVIEGNTASSTRFSWDACFWNPDTIVWGSSNCPGAKPPWKGTDSFHQLASHVSKLYWTNTLQRKSPFQWNPCGIPKESPQLTLHGAGMSCPCWTLFMLSKLNHFILTY